MHYFYKKKIRAQVIHAWKEANYLIRMKAIRQSEEGEDDEDEDEELKEDEGTKGIPFAFKMKIAKEMFSIESEAVKKEVETRRQEDAAPPELTQSEEMRIERLVTYQQYVLSFILTSQITNLISPWPGTLIVSAEQPTTG